MIISFVVTIWGNI